jgi:hypothetical protein
MFKRQLCLGLSVGRMHIGPIVALAISLSATAAIAPPGSSSSAPITAPFDKAATGSASTNHAPSGAPKAAIEVSARKWKLARKRLNITTSMNRRRALASRGRFIRTRPRTEPMLRRSEGAATRNNLPPNLGFGIGTGW